MRVSSKKVTQEKKDIEIGKKPTILNVHLLDRSYSMKANDKYINAVGGINEEMHILRNDRNANYLQTIIEFDSDGRIKGNQYNEAVVNQPLIDVEDFVGKGPRGGTPLYQAVGYVIEKMLALKRLEDRVVLKIFTDGEENTSDLYGKYNSTNLGKKALYDLIEKVKKENNFTIAFVGTPHDTETVINNLGIDRGNTFTHDNTARGVKMSYAAGAGATMAFAEEVKTRGATTSQNFYTKTVEN